MVLGDRFGNFLIRTGIKKLLKNLQETGLFDRLTGSGRPRTSRSCENISAVEELAQSRGSKSHTHLGGHFEHTL